MSPILRKKQATFKTVALADKPSHELIITHPFKNARLKHLGDVLELWARNLANLPKNRWNIRMYSFDVYEVFDSGPNRLKSLIARLQHKIVDLERDQESPLHHSSTPASASHDSKAKTSPVIVFVAHSLGAWIVKALTRSPSKAAGFIFLDAGVLPANEDYVQYLIKLTDLYDVKSLHTQRLKELCEFLQKADSIFHVDEAGSQDPLLWDHTKSPFQSRIVNEFVWMAEDSKRPQRLSRALDVLGLLTGGSNLEAAADSLAGQRFNKVDFESILSSIVTGELDVKRERTKELASSFFRTGEFHNARRLFSILDTQSSNLTQGQLFEVRLSLAQTFLYTGEYHEARSRLQDIKGKIEANKSGYRKQSNRNLDISLEVDRWIAFTDIFLGDYNDAVKRLRKMIDYSDDTISSAPESNDFFIAIRRDLALAYAHLGDYSLAETMLNQVDRNIGESRLEPNIHFKVLAHSVKSVRATLYMLRGEFAEALRISEAARQGLQEQLGRYHFQTLESVSLHIRILAYMSDFDKAQPLCDALIGDMARELGHSHPLTLGAMEILVHILRSKSRFSEALETARTLYSRTESCLKAEHPQTLRSRSHVAATHFEVGNYKTAQKEVEGVISAGDKCRTFGRPRPDLLEYYCVKARILNRAEGPQQSLPLALRTLEEQMMLYKNVAARSKGTSPRSELLQRPLTPPFKNIDKGDDADWIHSICNDIESNPLASEWNPALVTTLELVAQILSHDRNKQLRALDPGRIMEVVVNYRRAKLGHDHLSTLRSERLLALIARNDGTREDSLDYASDALYAVWRKLEPKLGQSHPLTLSVEREILVTDCMRSVWVEGGPARRKGVITGDLEIVASPDDPNQNGRAPRLTLSQWEDVEYVSEEILQSQEPQLGPWHPETLESLFWLLQVRSILKFMLTNSPESGIHIDVKTTSDDLLERLRNPNVAQERPHEAPRMVDLAREVYGEPDK